MPPIQAKTIDLLLVEKKLITHEQLVEAQKDAEEHGNTVAVSVVNLKMAAEDVVAKAIAEFRGTKFVDVTTIKPEIMEQLVKLCPSEIANKYHAIPVGKKFTKFTFAVADPLEPSLLRLSDDLFRGKPGEVEFWVSGEGMIMKVLEASFPAGASSQSGRKSSASAPTNGGSSGSGAIALAEGLENLGGPDDASVEVVQEGPKDEDSDEAVDQAPVIQLVNKIIYDAVERKVSDIHLDPTEQGVVLRYRMDGVLHDIMTIPPKWKRAVAAVIKVKTKLMRIEERRKPQDAKIKIKVPSRDKPIDLRVSTLPIVWGEKIVMRILDSSRLFGLEELGMEPEQLTALERAIRQPQGMVLVTGPTGSGKTNTLYSALNTLNTRDRNIMTIENPVEFQLPGINQVQINMDAGMTFPAALKAFLRQDPNVILVGEVRDFEEMDIAVKAAMVGQMVLTTLHTNDAPSTVTRILDIRDPVTGAGVDPGIVASAIQIVIAQRLMRRVCKDCAEPATYEPEFLTKWGVAAKDMEGGTFMKGKGCPKCNKTGNKGRVGIYEVMPMTRTLRDLIMTRCDANKLRDAAVKEGMDTLRVSAMRKARAGMSTLEEVIKVTLES